MSVFITLSIILCVLLAIATKLSIIPANFDEYKTHPPLEYDKDLKQSIIVFRHGMRSPSSVLSYDPYKDGKHWPDGFGQLTKEGKIQLFEMGRKIRRRYGKHLLTYNKNVVKDVSAVTTKFDRCFQSAGLILAGLCPPVDYEIWNTKLPWQPIPISYHTHDKAHILSDRKSCSRYWNELLKVDITREESDLIDHFRNYVKPEELKDHFDLFVMCDTIFTEIKLNLSQALWIEEVWPDKIQSFLKHGLTIVSNNLVMKRLFIGSLLADILNRINKVANNEKHSKIHLYASHDTSVHSLMYSLGFSPDFLPEYGSAVIFEIYSSSENYYVKILYNPSVQFDNLEVMTLPGCEPLCPLNKFSDFVKPLIVTNWDEECKF